MSEPTIQVIEEGGPLSTCHFIEFMACPGGCLGGGGQPIPSIHVRVFRIISDEYKSYA